LLAAALPVLLLLLRSWMLFDVADQQHFIASLAPTPSPPMPKFLSHSLTACSGVMMGSLVWRLSTWCTATLHLKSNERLQQSWQQMGRFNNQQQQCGGGLLLLLSVAEAHAAALTRMKSLPSPWYLQNVICSLPAICACSARAGAATANT
jgi:hypothetical protein